MSEIIEWLREMQNEYEGSGTVIDYAGHYKAAADRIEALAGEKTILIGRIEDLVAGIEVLEKELESLGRLVDWYQAEYVNNPPLLPHGVEQNQPKRSTTSDGDREKDH